MRNPLGPCWLLAAALALTASGPIAAAAESPPDEDWIRLTEGPDGKPQALQTGVGRYQRTEAGGQTITVDLVGAVHVGDRAYYRNLNERFEGYEVVLYELVAPPGTRVRPGQQVGSDNALGAMQNGMKSLLGLEHQLEWVDYSPANFVHADMSPDQLFASMGERGEGFLEMYFRLLGQSIAEQTKQSAAGESTEFDLLRAFFAADRSQQMRIAMAKQMASMEGVLSGFGGEKGSTIIHERNAIALRVLEQQLEQGRRSIAVFYGAGHLADMDARLRRDFGLEQTDKQWLDAWRLGD
ncbi:hypothetical protein [Botrimarina hoheduenensis]|nr:hypothetical protein [Botrimarina hoheduenensis]